MKKISAITLGCKVNQYESEAILRQFSQKGYEIDEDPTKADIIVVNSCTVTSVSAGKSRQAVRKAKKNNPDAIVILTGCYSQVDYKNACDIFEADIITGTNDKDKIVEYVESYIKNKNRILIHTEQIDSFIDDLPTPVSGSRTRAVLKIQDGCDNYCSYCIIPYARGPVRSREYNDVLLRMGGLAKAGYKETVITGIHLASYGKGTNKDLVDLLEDIDKEYPEMKIRLGSMDPSFLNEEKIIRLSQIKNLCKHYHLSLQSGCNETLRRMNRKYTVEYYAKVSNLLKQHIPDVSLTTDIIVGFPGETQEEFQLTTDFIKSIGFYRLHVFPYSVREGTKASKMPDMVTKNEKEARSKFLTDINRELMEKFHKRFMGREMKVLFETKVTGCEGYFEGLSDNYIRIISDNPDITQGEFYNVTLFECKGDYVIAK